MRVCRAVASVQIVTPQSRFEMAAHLLVGVEHAIDVTDCIPHSEVASCAACSVWSPSAIAAPPGARLGEFTRCCALFATLRLLMVAESVAAARSLRRHRRRIRNATPKATPLRADARDHHKNIRHAREHGHFRGGAGLGSVTVARAGSSDPATNSKVSRAHRSLT